MKKRISVVVIFLLLFCFLGCQKKSPKEVASENDNESEDYIVIGFSQLGAESDWRSANTESMKATFTEKKGYQLIFDDGQQKQANQIMAIREFIQQEVDYIVLAPVTETGWDTVLREAKDAGIPVIVIDRMVAVNNDNLFTCWLGSNFELEAKKATEWLEAYITSLQIPEDKVNIVNIQGTIGASAQIGRTKGLEDAVKNYGWNLLEETPGDFTQAKGREVMEYFLTKYDNINVVYCENDNEALGAIEAIEAAGKVAGLNMKAGEILVISFDGVGEAALNKALEGKIAFISECNPLHGPRVEAIIESLEQDWGIKKLSYVDENIYCIDSTIQNIWVDNIKYPVTLLTQEVINENLQKYKSN